MWAAAAAAAEEEGGRGRGEEGEVTSVMAVLHNFSEREQKESEGKWKARKEGACCILGGEAWHQLVFLFQFLYFQTGWESAEEWPKVCTWEWNRGVATEGLEPLGVVIQGAIKGQTHTDLHTPSLSRRAHTCRQTVKRKGMWGALLPVEYQLRAGERKTYFNVASSVTGTSLQPSFPSHFFILLVLGVWIANLAGRVKLSLQHGAEGYDYPVR